MLIEVHMLQNHAPSNLNRDDTNSPKSCVFGSVRRSRISSQCIKRSIRQSVYFKDLFNEEYASYRTRKLPQLIASGLIDKGISEDKAKDIAKVFEDLGKNKEKKDKKEGEKEKKPKRELETSQIMFFSSLEVKMIIEELYKRLKNENKSITLKDIEQIFSKNRLQNITPDIALFGRMITSDVFMNVEASMQVAHAISTNKLETEFDFFTAVDDLVSSKDLDNLGAGMIGDTEFNSSCYYKYFSLDVDGFENNLKQDLSSEELKNIIRKSVDAFLKSAIFVTPTGKQNSFAANQLPDGILIEFRTIKTPISYANAFLKPCSGTYKKDLMETSIERFIEHVHTMNNKFNLLSSKRLWFTTKDYVMPGTEQCQDINELINTSLDQIKISKS